MLIWHGFIACNGSEPVLATSQATTKKRKGILFIVHAYLPLYTGTIPPQDNNYSHPVILVILLMFT